MCSWYRHEDQKFYRTGSEALQHLKEEGSWNYFELWEHVSSKVRDNTAITSKCPCRTACGQQEGHVTAA